MMLNRVCQNSLQAQMARGRGHVPRRAVSPHPGQAELHVNQRATADSRVGGVSKRVWRPSSCIYLRFRLHSSLCSDSNKRRSGRG